MTTTTHSSGNAVAARGNSWYDAGIRDKIDIPENLGKMVIINVETGDYEVDEHGLEASHRLHAKRPNVLLYGIRIGYNVAESLGELWKEQQRDYG